MTITQHLQVNQPQFGKNKANFEVVAHRGARIVNNPDDIAPENTLPCFQQAAKRGASIELDVISTKDGRLVVHHDDQTGKIYTIPAGNKIIQDILFQDLQQAQLNVNGHEQDIKKMLGPDNAYKMHPTYLNTPLSTLEDVLEALPSTYFYIELKTYDKHVKTGRNNHLEELVAKVIRDKNLYHQVTVISFSRASLKKIKQIDPAIKTGLDFEFSKYIKHSGLLTSLFVKTIKSMLGVDSIHPPYEDTTSSLVKAAHRQNIRIIPWVHRQTVEEEKQWFKQLTVMGVDGLITNAVDVIQNLLKGTDSSQTAS